MANHTDEHGKASPAQSGTAKRMSRMDAALKRAAKHHAQWVKRQAKGGIGPKPRKKKDTSPPAFGPGSPNYKV